MRKGRAMSNPAANRSWSVLGEVEPGGRGVVSTGRPENHVALKKFDLQPTDAAIVVEVICPALVSYESRPSKESKAPGDTRSAASTGPAFRNEGLPAATVPK